MWCEVCCRMMFDMCEVERVCVCMGFGGMQQGWQIDLNSEVYDEISGSIDSACGLPKACSTVAPTHCQQCQSAR